MMKTVEGALDASGLRIGIVVSRFNSFICESLLSGAKDVLLRHGAKESQITIVRVPGSFEIPVVCKKLALSNAFDGLVALGAVIRGSTNHYDLVCAEVSKGISSVMLETSIPIGFGVITTDTIEQAIERAGTKAGNKGAEAALSTIEMVRIIKSL
jgi:6,7-dimethyl-8-ribityllumazine synthase